MNYEHLEDKLCGHWQVGSGVFRFEASSIRRTHTGVHATLGICWNGQRLVWSHINVERDEARLRLVNSAYKHMLTVKEKPNVNEVKWQFDNFCAGLWHEHTRQWEPEMLSGDIGSDLEYLLRPWVVRGGGTLVFAPPGRGKSWTGLLMAISVDEGCDTLWPCHQVPTLYINLERSKQSIRRRVAQANRVLGLEEERPLLFLQARGKALSEIVDIARRRITQDKVEFVILDSVSRAGLGDLKEGESANKVIDMLNGLCESWLGIGHTPRQAEGQDHIYGSVFFDAGCDVAVQLLTQVSDNGTLGIGLKCTKSNDMARPPMEVYAYEFGDQGLANVYPARTGQFPEVETSRKVSLADEIEEYLLDVEKATRQEISAELGISMNKVAIELKNTRRFVVTGREGKSRIYACLTERSYDS